MKELNELGDSKMTYCNCAMILSHHLTPTEPWCICSLNYLGDIVLCLTYKLPFEYVPNVAGQFSYYVPRILKILREWYVL